VTGEVLSSNNVPISHPHFFSVALRPIAGHGLLILEVSRSHTVTHHSRWGSSGRLISSSQRPLPDNTQHSQQTNIHTPGGIRTHDLSRRAAGDLRLRPRCHWDRHRTLNTITYCRPNCQYPILHEYCRYYTNIEYGNSYAKIEVTIQTIHLFIHLVVCLATGPNPLAKRALHIVRSRASSFK